MNMYLQANRTSWVTSGSSDITCRWTGYPERHCLIPRLVRHVYPRQIISQDWWDLFWWKQRFLTSQLFWPITMTSRWCSKSKATLLPPHRLHDCGIDLFPGTMPPKGRLYSLPGPETQAMKEYIQSSLQAGIIWPSSSPASSLLGRRMEHFGHASINKD